MKTKKNIFGLICIISIISLASSCEWLSYQDTDTLPITGLWKLKEIIGVDGTVTQVTGNDSIYYYREWYGFTNQQEPIDSIFFLKNTNKQLISKFAVTKILKYYKKPYRQDVLLSNNKYASIKVDWFSEENGDHTYMFVSEFVDDISQLNNVKIYKYISSDEVYP